MAFGKRSVSCWMLYKLSIEILKVVENSSGVSLKLTIALLYNGESLYLLFPTEMEFDLDKALEEVPIHVEDPPLPSPPPQVSDRMSYSEDLPLPPTPSDGKSVCLGELPQLEHKTLESCTKSRPKLKKRTKPSRTSVRRSIRYGYGFSIFLSFSVLRKL